MISAMMTKLKTVLFHKKSLKIRKVQSQSISQRRTDNTMAKGIKPNARQTMIYKTLHRKLKVEHHEPH